MPSGSGMEVKVKPTRVTDSALLAIGNKMQAGLRTDVV